MYASKSVFSARCVTVGQKSSIWRPSNVTSVKLTKPHSPTLFCYICSNADTLSLLWILSYSNPHIRMKTSRTTRTVPLFAPARQMQRLPRTLTSAPATAGTAGSMAGWTAGCNFDQKLVRTDAKRFKVSNAGKFALMNIWPGAFGGGCVR